jgi:hypothetical protein
VFILAAAKPFFYNNLQSLLVTYMNPRNEHLCNPYLVTYLPYTCILNSGLVGQTVQSVLGRQPLIHCFVFYFDACAPRVAATLLRQGAAHVRILVKSVPHNLQA